VMRARDAFADVRELCGLRERGDVGDFRARPAGSGKTEHCFRSIVEAMRSDPLGPPIYWLLTRQATFNAERELTCGSGLGAFCRTRVVSFEEFGRGRV